MHFVMNETIPILSKPRNDFGIIEIVFKFAGNFRIAIVSDENILEGISGWMFLKKDFRQLAWTNTVLPGITVVGSRDESISS